MNELKLTPIDQIEDIADGIPVLAVEGVVKYAGDLTRNKPDAAHPWTKQFFVLASGTAEIACSMWDAEGNEVKKGERIHIENTKNKKGEWKGMVKGSYQKNGERKHTLEIRAEQVKITDMDKRNNATRGVAGSPGHEQRDHEPIPDQDWPEAPATTPELPLPPVGGNGGVNDARKHLCQAANLYVLCVKCVDKMIAPEMPQIAQTSEQFQAAVGTLFIEASRAGYVQKMPETPLIK